MQPFNSTVCLFHRLPLELLDPLLDFALNPNPSIARQAAKFSQALVCKEWYNDRLERKNFILNSVSSTKSLIAVLEKGGGGAGVRELLVDYRNEGEAGKLDSLLEIFELCPKLESIIVPAFGSQFSDDRIFSSSSPVWEVLSKMSLLRFDVAPVRGQKLLLLYKRWPKLEELTTDYHFSSDSILSISSHITSLTYTIHDLPTLYLLRSFLNPSLKTLIITVSESIYTNNDQALVLSAGIGANLQHIMKQLTRFEYYRSRGRGELELTVLLEDCPLLERIGFTTFPRNLYLLPKIYHITNRTTCGFNSAENLRVNLPEIEGRRKVLEIEWIFRPDEQNPVPSDGMIILTEILQEDLVKDGWEVDLKWVKLLADGSASVWHGV